MSPLNDASRAGDTERVKQLLDDGAPVDVKSQYGRTALMLASEKGHTEVAKLLLDEGAPVDEKDELGRTALMLASYYCHTEVVKLLLENGALLDAADARGDAALLGLTGVDEAHLGRMAAAQTHRHLLQRSGESDVTEERRILSSVFMSEAEKEAEKKRMACARTTATAVYNLVRLAGSAAARARMLRSSDPRSADDHQALFGRLQLAAAACAQNDESGKARGQEDVLKLFRSADGRKALEYAVEIEAKELLAQPVVQKYINIAWRGKIVDQLLAQAPAWVWPIVFVVLLLQLLILLPLVALVPALEPWLTRKLGGSDGAYFLRLPVVKFGLECAADLALALVLTFLPAADLATVPVALLLLVWVGSGLLWEGRQLMAPSKSDAKSRLTRVYDRFAAYWGDNINRVDATALIFSLAALVAFVSTGDSEDAWATSLRAVAVFLLWLRVIRVLLVSPKFGPFVLMFFRMLFGDVLYFLVLLLFLLVAFAASWTVLLDTTVLFDTASSPPPDPHVSDLTKHLNDYASNSYELVGCHTSYQLVTGGNVSFFSTLLRLLEGAVSANDHFECARNSTKSPAAAWMISFVYVTLTAVLLLNMLIAMCAARSLYPAQSNPLVIVPILSIYYI